MALAMRRAGLLAMMMVVAMTMTHARPMLDEEHLQRVVEQLSQDASSKPQQLEEAVEELARLHFNNGKDKAEMVDGPVACLPNVTSVNVQFAGSQVDVAGIVSLGSCPPTHRGYFWVIIFGDGTIAFNSTSALGPFHAAEYMEPGRYMLITAYCSTYGNAIGRCSVFFRPFTLPSLSSSSWLDDAELVEQQSDDASSSPSGCRPVIVVPPSEVTVTGTLVDAAIIVNWGSCPPQHVGYHCKVDFGDGYAFRNYTKALSPCHAAQWMEPGCYTVTVTYCSVYGHSLGRCSVLRVPITVPGSGKDEPVVQEMSG